MKVGFIGLGNMGSPMAERLLNAAHEVTVYNRTAAKTQVLVSRGARHAATVAEACAGDAVFTMLADDNALGAVCFGDAGVLNSLRRGAIHISSSTISVALADRLAGEHEKKGQQFVGAPVFGRPEAAAAGKLFVVAAGDENSVRKCAPLFEAIGQQTFVFGEKPSLAHLVKLSGNFLIASVIESLSEVLALVGKAGLDARQYLEFLTSTLFNAPIYKTYGALIVEKKYTPVGFAAPLGLKDVKLALAAGEGLRVPLPIAGLIRDKFLTLLANGGESLDWVAISRVAAENAGMAS